MTNDTSIQSLFAHAQLPAKVHGDLGKDYPCVFFTWIEAFSNIHPSTSPDSADLVNYANGILKLSSDKKTLSGEPKVWQNKYYPGNALGSTTPADQFADSDSKVTTLMTITDAGKVTYQPKLNGSPIGGMPPVQLLAPYDSGLMVEKAYGNLRCLSFTLGWVYFPYGTVP